MSTLVSFSVLCQPPPRSVTSTSLTRSPCPIPWSQDLPSSRLTTPSGTVSSGRSESELVSDTPVASGTSPPVLRPTPTLTRTDIEVPDDVDIDYEDGPGKVRRVEDKIRSVVDRLQPRLPHGATLVNDGSRSPVRLRQTGPQVEPDLVLTRV